MLDTSSIAKLCESYPTKKFFVTLHDQRFLTGGCHYSNGCQQMYSGCTSCPQATLIGKIFVRKDFETKLEEFKKLTNLELIVPSLWLQEQARKSPFLSGFTVHLIRNPVPNVFFQKNSNITPPDKPAIIFISAQLGTKMKGLSVLVQALNLLAESGHSQEFELKLIGTGNFDVEIDPRISVKTIVTKSDFETSEELSRGKILVVPSIQDNLPSTMVEAICSGLSVIGSRTGGITEILTSYDQVLITVGDYKTLSERLLSLLRKKNSIDIEKARKEFSNRSIAAQLFKVYSGTTLPY
jgi:glycosyltransferase involved in cell wall biosynthesis